jgi:RNA polymerase subunit RPABC4/transcription elongation factor Spt4
VIVVACRRCNRAFGCTDRSGTANICPDCDKGPFDEWFYIVSTADELLADGGHKKTDQEGDSG